MSTGEEDIQPVKMVVARPGRFLIPSNAAFRIALRKVSCSGQRSGSIAQTGSIKRCLSMTLEESIIESSARETAHLPTPGNPLIKITLGGGSLIVVGDSADVDKLIVLKTLVG